MKYFIVLLLMILGSVIDGIISNDWSFSFGYVVGALCTMIIWHESIMSEYKREKS